MKVYFQKSACSSSVRQRAVDARLSSVGMQQNEQM
jgi:hypothetical protein